MTQFKYASVIVPVPVAKTFTYTIVEFDAIVSVGMRVVVPFGKRQILTGVIAELHNTPPKKYTPKAILEVLDTAPSITALQIEFFKWMAAYYMGYLGEVLNNALPSGLKVHSESRIAMHPEFDLETYDNALSENEVLLLNTLKSCDTLTYDQVQELTELKQVYSLIKSLYYKEAILLFENFKEKYSPKIEVRIRLSEQFNAEAPLDQLLQQLEKKPKQADILLKYLQECPIFQDAEVNQTGVPKSIFKKSGLSESSVNTLLKNGIFERFDVVVARTGFSKATPHTNQLSEIQIEAYQTLLQEFNTHNTVLLEGVTGSGKTELYIRLIQEVIANGGEVLYVLPEIALSTQIVDRLSRIFGESLGVYHSKYSDNERVEVWNKVLQNKLNLVIGVRSSIFLPFKHLELIIVDEEHETSFKQFEKSPRYHARDSALKLAQLHGAKVLLGSATPSIETMTNVQQNRFGYCLLKERYNAVPMPEINLIDLKKEQKRKAMKGSFAPELVEAIETSLLEGKQSIIFQNRRGYAPLLCCNTCGWIPQCESCSVSLTYHLHKNELKCHYCGFSEFVPKTCEACGAPEVQTVGFGTEKLQEELEILFPDATIGRMDQDTTKSKYGYQRIIQDFEEGRVDILVGTQMVSKGLDFENVQNVGIMNADSSLFFPDFRSYERAYHLMVQVSGRAGRKLGDGKVFIQTRQPEHSIFDFIKKRDNKGFYNSELEERKLNYYPPFTRLIKVTIKHKDKILSQQGAQKLCNALLYHLGTGRILGPTEPIISKVRNYYINEILVKVEKQGIDIRKVKSILQQQKAELLQEQKLKATKIIFDVDPY